MAYILAHNEVYGTDIKEGHIFMCTRDLKYQQFSLLPSDFNKYQDMWLDKVEKFYTTGLLGLKKFLA
jgi:genome maintenance exonuclease 1